MADSWMDHIPSHEREKIRRRMRSPEAYEALRDKVKGPEDLEKEMKRNEALADLGFGLETQGGMKEELKRSVEQDLSRKGLEGVLESSDLPGELKSLIEQGKFDLRVEGNRDGDDRLVAVPEGNVQETIPLKASLTEKYVSQLTTEEKTRQIRVSVDGAFAKEITIPLEIYEDDMVSFAVRHPAVSQVLRGRKVRSYAYRSGGILELATR